MDFWREFLINNAIGMVLSSVTNPESQAKYKRAFLKMFKAIKAAFAGDSDFQ